MHPQAHQGGGMSDNSDFIQELKVVYNLKSDEELIIKLYMDKSALLSRVKEARKEIMLIIKNEENSGAINVATGSLYRAIDIIDNLIPEAKEDK
jgi:hypothetical protein